MCQARSFSSSITSMEIFLGHIFLALTLLLHSSIQATTSISHVYVVYLGANRLKNAALASNHHLHLLSKVFTSKEDAEQSMLYSYNNGFSGFSAKLNASQATSLASNTSIFYIMAAKSFPSLKKSVWFWLSLKGRFSGTSNIYSNRTSSILFSYTKTGYKIDINKKIRTETGFNRDIIIELNQVITVFKSKSLKLHTTRSWDFLGLAVDNARRTTPPPQLAYGSDIVVGIFDTGIWPESESFREPPEAKPIPSSWNGECVGGEEFDASVHCNRKLIGARFYLRGFEETYGPIDFTRDPEYRSPRDYLGHGTHTASTAVGSVVCNVSGFSGLGRGTARGGAPLARLAVFKTCWGKDLEGVCTEADILAAFDDAIHDGVHVISASFGYSPPLSPFFESSADIGAFHAAERGISVVFSGGNDGPDPGVVQNVAPWAVSVAASTVDRSFPTRIVIDGSFTLTGQSLISQEITGTLALATTYFNGGVCKWENWLKKLANGTIILCFSTLGPVQFIEEAQAAAIRANALALIFAASPTRQLAEEVDMIPTVRVDILHGTMIRNYLARSPTVPILKIGPSKTVIGETTAPSVAYFSSRGPNSLSPDILKPDITAPGIGILAAWPHKTPPTLLPGDHRSIEWNFQSGTSMSCPHVAGIMALLQSAHPDWSPSAIRSAIMTTAYTRDTTYDLILSGGSMKSTDPFDIGAGHINPLKAMDPGLVYNTRTEDYVLFMCNIGYTDQQIKSMVLHPEPSTTCLPSHLYRTNADFNYPSITIPSLRFTRTIKRTVSNVGPNKNTVYFVDIIRPMGVEVVIWPRILVFSKCQQEHSYYVTFKPTEISSGRYVFGEIMWTDGLHRVRSPLVVFLSNARSSASS